MRFLGEVAYGTITIPESRRPRPRVEFFSGLGGRDTSGIPASSQTSRFSGERSMRMADYSFLTAKSK